MPIHQQFTLFDKLLSHQRFWPDKIAVVDDGGQLRLTYQELFLRVEALADAMLGSGVKHGERVLWLGQNSFRILETMLACAKIGAIFCPVNWRQSAVEMAFVIDDLTPQLIIAQVAEIGDRIDQALTQTQHKPKRCLYHDVQSADPLSYELFLANGKAKNGNTRETDVLCDDTQPLLILYTSAFSGNPCGAMFSHRALLTQSCAFALYKGIGVDDIYLNVGPLFHVATLVETCATFFMAGTNVFTPRSDAEEICRLITEERCNSAFILGPVIEQIIKINAARTYDLSSLRALVHSTKWDEMITVDRSSWGLQPYGYGQTETLGYVTYTQLVKGGCGSMGRAAPFIKIMIADEDGCAVAAGTVGEILVQGLSVMSGYWLRPEENHLRCINGWHRTNDLGRIEEDGSLTFIGPKTRLIRSGQENIYPAEVEACIRTHAAIADVAVIGVPDVTWDQSVKAIVVVRQNHVLGLDELIQYCQLRMASYKKPKHLDIVGNIPRQNGQVDYAALDLKHGGGGYPGAGNTVSKEQLIVA